MQRADRLGVRNLFPEGATAEATVAVAIGAGVIGLVSWKALDASPGATALATICGAVIGAGLYAASMTRRVAVRRVEPESDEPGVVTPIFSGKSSSSQPQSLRIAEVVNYLQEHLGSEVTAFLSGTDDVLAVKRWSSGEAEPGQLDEARLRFGYAATRPIVEAYDGETATAWLFGMNEWLEDEAPVQVLREGQGSEDWTPVVDAAEGFAELGR